MSESICQCPGKNLKFAESGTKNQDTDLMSSLNLRSTTIFIDGKSSSIIWNNIIKNNWITKGEFKNK